jgi:DNA-binding response OmpR family regulator
MKNPKTSQSEAPAGAPHQRPARSAPRILVVDEDRDLRQLYTEALAVQGYVVDAAEDGAAAWEALKANCYHLLITEHAIPNLTGVELVKLLRAARMAVPVVMAAERLPTHELARNPALQLAATLLKPFPVGALVDTVNNVLRATDTAPEPTKPVQNWRQPTGGGLWVS